MKNKHDILQELLDIGPLIAGVQAVNPFVVPIGYFDAFPELMLEKVRIESLLGQSSVNTYQAPMGYFESLSATILEKIKNSSVDIKRELDEVAPLLNTISKQQVYTVPDSYFAELDAVEGIKKIKEEPKVITLRIARKWMQFAAAAVMAGVLVTGAFLYTDGNNEATGVSYELNKVSDTELVEYVDNPEHFVAAPAATSLASESELIEIKNNIQQVSDEELNQYLKENAESFDIVASEKE